MPGTAGAQGPGDAPAAPASAVWLRNQLLEITSALRPDRRPEMVREWTDPVRWRDPAPVGHCFLFLLCLATDDRPTPPDDVLDAFTTAGWGVCQECGGRAYSGGSGGYGRCGCAGNNAGPGRCMKCGGTGLLTAEEEARLRRRHGDDDAFRQLPPEDGHASNTGGFLTVSRRPCRCGEFRCSWRNTLTRTEDHLLSHFHATCRTCATRRTHTFRLPLH
ncbi:hypothetical protein [Streptomyces sp. IBSNAI001]|uniref:hypothetical protein n=1 Tax=Streptomyces sp. IBSNAI001 TaxID=3457499 RepID=UPI003FD4C101